MASSISDTDLSGLATYLFTRREAILNHWRNQCEQDTTLLNVSGLAREEFNNMIPLLLTILHQRLQKQPEGNDPVEIAAAHGLHRWQKGLTLKNLLAEINYLYAGVIRELQLYREFFPDSDADVLIAGYQEVDRLKTETMLGSVREYDQQQQLAAASRANRLQYTLDQLQDMTRLRGDLLRTSSHDLKSSFGVVRNAAILLDQAEKPEEERTKLLQMLNRNLGNIHEMLQQLTDLSRLEAGYEVLDIQRFDASQLLYGLVESAQPLAVQKGLILRADGPPELLVSNDSVKIHRIVQNLLLNAIKYTQTGIVSVSWSKEGDFRWYISVQDSGPGLSDGLVALFSKQLMPKAEESGVLQRDFSEVDEVPNLTSEELDHATSKGLPVSEGVGLLIVKRLCELLGGMVEIESIINVGTLFRIRLMLEHKA